VLISHRPNRFNNEYVSCSERRGTATIAGMAGGVLPLHSAQPAEEGASPRQLCSSCPPFKGNFLTVSPRIP